MTTMVSQHFRSGVVAAAIGTAMVFGLVISMNEFADRSSYDDGERQTSFVLQAPPPPEQAPEPEPEPEPPMDDLVPPPPLADLSADVGSVDIPVPGLDNRALDAAAMGDNNGDLVMTDDSVDDPPRPTRQAPMKYPTDAKRKGVEGYVTLSLLINETGDVRQVRVLESEPAGVFDLAAVDAVRQWHFEPARYQGEQVKVWARQKISFNLD